MFLVMIVNHPDKLYVHLHTEYMLIYIRKQRIAWKISEKCLYRKMLLRISSATNQIPLSLWLKVKSAAQMWKRAGFMVWMVVFYFSLWVLTFYFNLCFSWFLFFNLLFIFCRFIVFLVSHFRNFMEQDRSINNSIHTICI